VKVSVITIAYNSAETIEDTIKSVVSQDYPELEYIIIDGGSTDNTLKIIDRYKDHISNIISEPDKGIYDAMNKGVANATGELVGILNSDDIYADDKVVTDIVNQLGDKDAIYADLVYVKRDAIDEVTRYWKSGEYTKGDFVKGWMPPHPTFFVRKRCYDAYGTYDLRLKSAADYECMLRMIHKNNISLAYLPRVITKMRVGGQSNANVNNRVKANQEDRMAWEMNGLKPRFYTLYLKPLRKIGQFLKKG
jgi:glycosyltransferase involved in cell wall biosynthesis